jgi:hypothetical protein
MGLRPPTLRTQNSAKRGAAPQDDVAAARVRCRCFNRLQHHGDAICAHADQVAGLGWPASEVACRAGLALKDLADRLWATCPLREGANPEAGCRRGAA